MQWFFSIGQTGSFTQHFLSYQLGYGGGFWVLLQLGQANPMLTKTIFLGCLSVPLGITLWKATPNIRLLGVCFWLTSYAAWWNGKIVSPDSLQYALLACVILLLNQNRVN